jgi:hypothetical protein
MPRGIVIEIIGDERSYLRSSSGRYLRTRKRNASFKSVEVNASTLCRRSDRRRDQVTRGDARQRRRVRGRRGEVSGWVERTDRRARPPGGSAGETESVAWRLSVSDIPLWRQRQDGRARPEQDDERSSRRFGDSFASRPVARLRLSGFIAASLAAAGIVSSIKDAENLARAQESLSVAIEHTGGDLGKLRPQYTATAKAAAQFGVDQIEATTGLARATVLTGNAAAAQRAYQEALVISKATGKDFNIVLTAAAKGQAGITTSLRRYGILVDVDQHGAGAVQHGDEAVWRSGHGEHDRD